MKGQLVKIIIICLLVFTGLYFLGYRIEKKDISVINNGEPIIFAHRGIRNYAIENSLESYNFADRLNFKALEIDVSLTKDQIPVIFHDDNCKRVLGIDANINDLNYSFIKDKPLIYQGNPTANKILTLNFFFKEYQQEKIIYVDIKTPTKQLADSLSFFLTRSKKYETTLIADDNIFFLGYLKYKNNKIITILEGFNKGKEWTYFIIPHKYRPDFYASFLSEVDNNHMNFLRKYNIVQKKIVYNVDKNNLQTVFDFGLQNIIIDFDSTMVNSDEIVRQIKYNRYNTIAE